MDNDIVVFNQQLEVIGNVDSYDSLLWNIKYRGYGDFELKVPYSQRVMDVVKRKNYIYIPHTTDRYMIIQSIRPNYSDEKGIICDVRGRSLESILLRRIIWNQTILSGNVQDAVERVLNENLISPVIAARAIPNFIFERSDDPAVVNYTLEKEHQYTGNYVYDVVNSLCAMHRLGWKVYINEYGQFVFTLIAGIDRTSNQTELPVLEFSSDNDNLVSTDFTEDETDYKNVTLIAGEGEGVDRKTATYGEASGIDRCELFTDARDLSSNVYDEQTGEETTMSEQDYLEILQARGKEKLEKYKVKTEFDSEVDSSDEAMYKYGEDYFLGDVVDVVDFIGQVYHSRIIELTVVINESEYGIHPIFSDNDDEDIEEEE